LGVAPRRSHRLSNRVNHSEFRARENRGFDLVLKEA
jgi:hypothetical protein